MVEGEPTSARLVGRGISSRPPPPEPETPGKESWGGGELQRGWPAAAAPARALSTGPSTCWRSVPGDSGVTGARFSNWSPRGRGRPYQHTAELNCPGAARSFYFLSRPLAAATESPWLAKATELGSRGRWRGCCCSWPWLSSGEVGAPLWGSRGERGEGQEKFTHGVGGGGREKKLRLPPPERRGGEYLSSPPPTFPPKPQRCPSWQSWGRGGSADPIRGKVNGVHSHDRLFSERGFSVFSCAGVPATRWARHSGGGARQRCRAKPALGQSVQGFRRSRKSAEFGSFV